VIFCEGRNTEPSYFHALKRIYSNALIKVETIGGAGVPYTLATAAVKRANSRRERRSSFEERDQIWAVFDRDDHPRFADAVTKCQAKGVGVARSNPCFEVWLILHKEDYDKPDGRHGAQARFRVLCPDYELNGAKVPPLLVEQVEKAERRAEIQLSRRAEERKPYGQPSTTVGRLTRAIREAALEAAS